MRVKMILPALTEATSPFFRPIKYSLFPPLGLATLAAYLPPDAEVTIHDEHVQTLRLDDDPLPDLVAIQVYITSARRSYEIADHYRRRHDRFSVPVAELPEAVDPSDDWDAALDRIVAESVLARLPEQHRTVLALRYMDDCSVPECAELIGRTVHATEALLVRARRAFRSHYPEPEGGKP